MTTKTRVVIATRPGGPEVLQFVARPRPVPGEGEMLVRVRAAGMNRMDVLQRQGNYPLPPDASDVLGLEVAGVVESLGSGANRFKRGDRVMALVTSGAYADWAVVQEASALPIPEGLPFASRRPIVGESRLRMRPMIRLPSQLLIPERREVAWPVRAGPLSHDRRLRMLR